MNAHSNVVGFLWVLSFPSIERVESLGYRGNGPTVIGICCYGDPVLVVKLNAKQHPFPAFV